MGHARELMDRATAAVIAGELEALREIYAEDVVATTPDEGTLHGIDAFIDWNRSFVAAFDDRAYEPQRELDTQDCAVDQGWFSGTHTRDMPTPDGQTIPATGRRIRMRAVDVATVRGDRIVQHDFYFDQLDLLSQLGVMQPGLATSA